MVVCKSNLETPSGSVDDKSSEPSSEPENVFSRKPDEDVAKYHRRMKKEFALHVALIQRENACSTGEAKFLAWLEGMEALTARLSS